eukprot:TRINITY_DN1758_c0_g4_i1.p1 TRINITY_DN1758_c0_g4~~TRINITY_DN1758_c0_g4_i1.p1  ORF type:complete len:114 (-),score=31.89 TRINITY_DN1758_c0_g4_i1:479-820(-)
MIINRVWRSQQVFARMFSKVIDDYIKSESAKRIPKTSIKTEDKKSANKVTDSELFLLSKSNEGVAMQFAKLGRNLLIRNTDLQLLGPYKDNIRASPELQLYCDGTSRQKVGCA